MRLVLVALILLIGVLQTRAQDDLMSLLEENTEDPIQFVEATFRGS